MCLRLCGGDDHVAVVDVLVDIDATLVYPAGGGPPLDPPGRLLLNRYTLAHGALEFLAALDAWNSEPNTNIRLRVGLYSCGPKERNIMLAKALIQEIHKQLGYHFKQKLKAFSVPDGNRGKKILTGLRRGLDVGRAIVVDDGGRNVHQGEESNLLKIYEFGCHSHDLTSGHKLYRARLSNNLVRALGMIFKSIDLSRTSGGSTTVVQALRSIQWDSKGMYLHDSSNAKDIYEWGLKAMKGCNPNFSLAYATTCPWAPWPQDEDEEAIFPRQRNLIIGDCRDAL